MAPHKNEVTFPNKPNLSSSSNSFTTLVITIFTSPNLRPPVRALYVLSESGNLPLFEILPNL